MCRSEHLKGLPGTPGPSGPENVSEDVQRTSQANVDPRVLAVARVHAQWHGRAIEDGDYVMADAMLAALDYLTLA